MQPQPFSLGNLPDAGQVVHRSRVGRAGRGNDEERPSPARSILGDGTFERVRTHAAIVVGGNDSQVPSGKPGEDDRLLDAVMDLIRRVDHAVPEVFSQAEDSCGDEPPESTDGDDRSHAFR